MLSVAPAQPPTEFKLFAAGPNPTSKGVFIFDAAAARSVMAAFKSHGVDLPIDLEHLSLSDPSQSARTDGADARGWFKLAVKADGSLWAVDVRWTPDGERRLRDRTQRYISPAFCTEQVKGGGERVLSVTNCALCAMPATHNAAALVAASRSRVLSARVTPEAFARVRAIAAARRTTVTVLLHGAIATLGAAAWVAPTKEMIARLDALVSALGLEKDSAASDILDAIGAILAATQTPDLPGDDPVTQMPDPPPASALSRLSAADQAVAARLTNPAQKALFIELRSRSSLK